MTTDYDFGIHPDDMERFDTEAPPFKLIPDRAPLEARRLGRCRLQNDELVDPLGQSTGINSKETVSI